MAQKTHTMHGRDHMPGGADPMVPSLPSGTVDQVIVATLPGAYYKVPETTGVWHDSSGAGRDATFTDLHAVAGGSAPTRGVASGLDEGDGSLCVTVAGPDPWAALSDSSVGFRTDSWFDFDGHQPFTVSCRIRPASVSTGGISFSNGLCGNSAGTGGSVTASWGLYLLSELSDPDGAGVAGKPAFIRREAGVGQQGVYAAVPVTLGEWVRLTGVYDGTTTGLYIDDRLAGAALPGSSNISLTTSQTFRFGAAFIAEGSGGTFAPYQGDIDSIIVWDRALSMDEIQQIVDGDTSSSSGVDPNEGKVLGVGDDGSIGWVDPKVEVTVNGEPTGDTSTAPPPDATPGAPAPPPTGGTDGLSWIRDQPFLWNGSSFTVEPNRWTTIPFTDMVMVRYSNQTSRGGTCDIEISPTDPAAAGWLDPADPHAIQIPHDMVSFYDHESWIQICLRLESPQVEPSTSSRLLRVFETTTQKTAMRSGHFRNFCCVGHGAISVYRDPLAAWTPPPDGTDTFAEGDTGGLDPGTHDRIMFALSSEGEGADYMWTYFPKNAAGVPMFTAGMRLVAQVWHNASQALTFEAGGTTPSFGTPAHAPYRPHFAVYQVCPRSWGAPWSSWPTYP
jgi:Concanavalin A-like lectin/glucanases superfamily